MDATATTLSSRNWREGRSSHYPVSSEDLAERVEVDDVAAEMHGLPARFLSSYSTTRANGSAVRFAAGSTHAIENWNGSGSQATVDGAAVPKTLIAPEPPTEPTVRRYVLNLAGQRRAIEANRRRLAGTLPAAERARLAGLLARRERVYSRMWVRQMMYNRFDVDIARWTAHYNTGRSPSTPLDPNIPKSIFFQESRMGTSGQHLELPPYDWARTDRHPIRSRFNIGQAIDSWGPQQWLMIREMAPAIATANGLDVLAARRRWYGMTNTEFAGFPGFIRALRQFFEARVGGRNLMGTPGRDLHEDYGFWIRTAIRWLFVKFEARRGGTWEQAVRAYNGSGPRAENYRREVMARVGELTPLTASESLDEAYASGTEDEDAVAPTTPAEGVASLAEGGPRLDGSARLTWQDLARMPNARGVDQLFYVVTGAPPSRARAGDESHAVFNLRVRNTNSVYNHVDVVTKTRLLQILRGRRFRTAYPDPARGAGWSVRRQPELPDESSRVIPVRFPRDALLRAYDSDYPMARVELEYHWRELGESRQRHYNRTGLDFVLVAPIEYLISQRQRISELRLDSPTRHKDDFWIPVGGVDFGPSIREPVTVSYSVRSELSRGAERGETSSRRTSQSRTQSSTSSNTFSASLTAGASQEASAGASVEILELGLKRMFQIGATIGYSRTTTDTSSSTAASEFARSIALSTSYRSSQSTSSQVTLTISPPPTLGPEPSGGQSPGRSTSVGLYLYPIVVYHDVPYVRFGGVNRLGQATTRAAGRVIVPFVREWRLVAD